METLDRRSFLKGLAATVAVGAIVGPAVSEASVVPVEVTATVDVVHEGDEVVMHRDRLEPFINREIRSRGQIGMSRVQYYEDNVRTALGHAPQKARPQYTWPSPRRVRGGRPRRGRW